MKTQICNCELHVTFTFRIEDCDHAWDLLGSRRHASH